MPKRREHLTEIEAEVLALLETLEAEQINLGLYATHICISDLCTGKDRRKQYASLSKENISISLQALVAKGEIFEWKKDFYRSKIAETVRALRLVRQRLWYQKDLSEAPLIVEDIRVEFRQRYRPNRKAVTVAKTLNQLSPNISEDLAESFKKAIRFETMSHFQAEALQKIYTQANRGNSDQNSFIIAGDTGAGKTEAFLFPILLYIASELPNIRSMPGVRAILVYPRIRLARNQLSRFLRYTTLLHASQGPRITIGIQNGDVPKNRNALSDKWGKPEERNGKNWYRVALLESCVNENCGGSYWVAEDDQKIDTGCPLLICDVCSHTINTLSITQAALESTAPDILIITDVSLSQWLTREKYSHLWGLWSGNVVTIAPRFLVLDEIHLYEQLKGAQISRLVKRVQARTRLASLETRQPYHLMVIGVSATLSNEKRFLAKLLDIDPQDEQEYQKLIVIKPAEKDLDKTKGRERYIFIYPRSLSPTIKNSQYRVNDQAAAIQIIMTVMHNLKNDLEWRGLAFFDSINDLRQFRHNYDTDSSIGEWIIDDLDPSDQKKEIPPANQDQLWRIRTDGFKILEDGKKRALAGLNKCQDTCEKRLQNGTLSECRHFRNGDCWILAKTIGWNEPLHVAKAIYAGASAELDGQDLIPSSPSLEVGYDDDSIQLVYQHKAPSNAASFIQRRGRAGRDPEDSPVIVTLLWPYRRDDAFYFFHPEALYDPIFEDVPLNASNFNVQRSHTLLAFFDLLACLRRQNLYGLNDDPQITDFTQAGWQDLVLDTVQDFTVLDDPRRKGQKRFVIKHSVTKESIWVSGKPVEQEWIREVNEKLVIKGWLAMGKGLTSRILLPVWKKLHEKNEKLFQNYLNLSQVASQAFQDHHLYPFRIPSSASLPSELLNRFGNTTWHANNDNVEPSNWVKTYRHIDWMLQGNDEATTLIVHYQSIVSQKSPDVLAETQDYNVEITYALNELLPGNVSYRTRDDNAIHWTPIPKNGDSTFLYPYKNVEVEGEIVRKIVDTEYEPVPKDLASKSNSIFGVPRYLDDQFPGLPFIELQRLLVEAFGPPDKQYSPDWVFVPDAKKSDAESSREGYATSRKLLNAEEKKRALSISRRSSARANSVIIPYVTAARSVSQKQLFAPLDILFAAIDGYLVEGRAMLGYTRVFYEMQIDLKTDKHDENRSLHRYFYPAHPQRDDADRPKPVLVGYTIDTQGIHFQVNPDLINETVKAVLNDKELRLHLRRNFAIHEMAPNAAKWQVFIKAQLDYTAVTTDYWLHSIVPTTQGEPRLLDKDTDFEALLEYYQRNRIVIKADVDEFANYLRLHEDFFPSMNDTLTHVFKDTPQFFDFVTSVVLHSLSALLKNLVARLGGVSGDRLVAYADLPILDQVDRSIDPRILIMDTIEGGSGGVAQAFERLDVTDNEGSLWWTLQKELGYCPIGTGEALVQTVLTKATAQQILGMQNKVNVASEDWLQLCASLGMKEPEPATLSVLSRTILKQTEISGQPINPALILKDLFAFQMVQQTQLVCAIDREAIVGRIVSSYDPQKYPSIEELKSALTIGGVAQQDLNKELALQLLALYKQSCQDGCPVCLSANSDIEHYYLAPLLNSRRTLSKLRQVLLKSSREYECLVSLDEKNIHTGQILQIQTNPGSLGNQLNTELGIGIVTQTDNDGQVQGTAVVIVDPERAKSVIRDGAWNEVRKTNFLMTSQGVQVHSKAEYIIASMLEVQDIDYTYEPKLPYYEDGSREKYIHPNFYLPDYKLYVEYWGRTEAEYIESRPLKEQIYRQLIDQQELRIVFLEPVDVQTGIFMGKIRDMMGSL